MTDGQRYCDICHRIVFMGEVTAKDGRHGHRECMAYALKTGR
jgi:hypothetical protein